MKISADKIPARMRAGRGSLAGGRELWRDSGAVSTKVAVRQSDYAIGVRDTHLHCRTSAPIGRTASRVAGRAMFGRAWRAVHDGFAVWAVVRGGLLVHRRVGVLNFQHLLEHNDTVWCEYYDRDGNRGGWVTHTAVVTGTIDHHQYVDTGGSDAANGLTPATAVATAYRARLNMEAVLGADQVGAIHYARDQVHNYTASTQPWQGQSSTVRRRCILDAYGTGADPILRGDGSAVSAVGFGNLDSVEVHGLRLEGQRASEVNCIGVICSRTAGARSPLDLIIRDCELVDYRAAVEIQDNQHNKAARALGHGDFLCLWHSTFDRSGSLHLFDSLCSRYVSVTSCFFGQTFGESGPNIFRVANWGEWVVHDAKFESQSVTSFRFQVGRPETSSNDIDEAPRGSMSDTTLKGRDPQQSGFSFGRHAPANDTAGWLRDVRMVNCRAENGRLSIEGVSGAQNHVERFQVWNCTFAGAINLMSADQAGENGTLVECDFIDNATLGCRYLDEFSNPTGTGPAFRLGGTRQRYAEGAVRIRGHKAIWPTGTEAFNENLIDAPRMLEHELRDRVDSDWNHTANQDAGVPGWVSGGVFVEPVFTLAWSASLATWQATTANDASSTTRASSLLGVTSLGTRALYQSDMDARPSGTNPVANLGWPRAAPSALDADGQFRFDPPDPGPFEEDPVDEPAGPPGLFDPITAVGGVVLELLASSTATTAATAIGGAVLEVLASSSAAAAITAQGGAFLELQASSEATTAVIVPGFGVKLRHVGTDRFVGWLPLNTDLPLAVEFGQRNGVTWWRGEPTGIDTRRVYLFVDLAPGASLDLPDLIAQTQTPPTVATFDPDFAEGELSVDGVPMEFVRAYKDGPARRTHYQLRSGIWMLYAWTVHVPGEPWVRGTFLALHSNPTSPLQASTWPGWTLSWGKGQIQMLGRAGDGSLFDAGRGWGDGQAQSRPFVAWWPTLYRDDQDPISVAALRAWAIRGHAIQRIYHDGNPRERPGSATWAASALTVGIACLDNWNETGSNILKEAGPTGNQADHGWPREEACYYPEAAFAIAVQARRFGAKPKNHVELDGRFIDLAARPRLRLLDGRPHPPTTQDEPGQPGSGMLGKLGPQSPANTDGWGGDGWEHWLNNGLIVGCRLTGDDDLQWLIQSNVNCYLGSRFPPGLGSNSALFSTRGLLMEAQLSVLWWDNLADRAQAAALAARIQARAPIWTSWINPVHAGGFPADYWQVYTTTPTASVPNLPAYIPWQQGPASFFLDLNRRVFGGALEGLVGGITAGAYRVLADVWVFEFSPEFDDIRWVEYERQQLPPPWGAGIKGRDGDWAIAWLPPLIALVRRWEPTTPTEEAARTKADAIWVQMLDQAGGGGAWFPPTDGDVPTTVGRFGTGGVFLEVIADGSTATMGPAPNGAIGGVVLEVLASSTAATRIVAVGGAVIEVLAVTSRAQTAAPPPPQPPPLPPWLPWWWRNLRGRRSWWQR